MKRLLILPVLAFAACAGKDPVGPGPNGLDDLPAFDQASMPGALEFAAQIVFVGPVEDGVTRVTPGGVMHVDDIVYEWSMSGDMAGPWYFIGKYKVNLNNGTGRAVGQPLYFEVHSSKWGMAGAFECASTTKIEHFPTDETIQYGHISGCQGTGDFAGLNLRAYITNVAHPGFDGSVYDINGVIW